MQLDAAIVNWGLRTSAALVALFALFITAVCFLGGCSEGKIHLEIVGKSPGNRINIAYFVLRKFMPIRLRTTQPLLTCLLLCSLLLSSCSALTQGGAESGTELAVDLSSRVEDTPVGIAEVYMGGSSSKPCPMSSNQR